MNLGSMGCFFQFSFVTYYKINTLLLKVKKVMPWSQNYMLSVKISMEMKYVHAFSKHHLKQFRSFTSLNSALTGTYSSIISKLFQDNK